MEGKLTKDETIRWKWIALCSLPGLLMAILSLNANTKGYEPVVWIVFGIAIALFYAKKLSRKIFLHGFLTGLCWGIINALVQYFYFDSYISANPELKESYGQIDFMEPHLFVLLTGPATGVVTGIILGGLSWVLKKNHKF